MSYEHEPLPDGWVLKFDAYKQQPFWVRTPFSISRPRYDNTLMCSAVNHAHHVYVQIDTQAKPPRPTWVHPYEDAQFLREHPDIRARVAGKSTLLDDDDEDVDKQTSSTLKAEEADTSSASLRHRSFLGKLKDKAIGSKEEREVKRREQRQCEELYMQQLSEPRRLILQRQSIPKYASGAPGLGPF
ncbi:hypothetical protein BD413DRAFT_577756 [Trametes elegans]|nr:hypothetical protein BD413DRAFT_577756 [Trametes elegans]